MRVLGLAALALAALTFGIAVAAGAFQQGSNVVKAVVPPSPAPAELAAIQQLVLRAAARMGDPSPTDGVLVPTTSRLAELVDVDTAEPDTPVYFVLVHGRFTDHSAPVPKGAKASTAALLTLTIDPGTNQSINTRLVSAAPDLNAIGTPEPLSLGTNTDPTADVPCPTGHERLVGPKALRRFHAVGAVSCTDGIRTYPGHGQWRVRVGRVAVGSVAGLQRYFEQPNGPKLGKGQGCLLVARIILVPAFVDRHGHWLVPRTPVDGCGQPQGGYGPLFHAIRWHVVSVDKVRLMISAAALGTHCAMEIKDLPAGGIGPILSTSGGPLFKSSPRTVHACIYRTPRNDLEVGNFVRGFSLGVAQTQRLLGAMTGGEPRGSCPNERTFAVIHTKPELWAEVELGGCFRVGRTYPDYGMGEADPAVVRSILGVPRPGRARGSTRAPRCRPPRRAARARRRDRAARTAHARDLPSARRRA